MKLKLAVMNLQSGIGVTKGYLQYVTRAWRYWLAHPGEPVEAAAQMLAAEQPDIVLVIELDAPSRRSRFTSHIEILQKSTSLASAVFFPTKKVGSSIQEGSAILSTFPFLGTKLQHLKKGINPRVLGRATISIDSQEVTVFVAHLALGTKRRAQQIQEISEIIRKTEGPIILGGDFNERKEVLSTLFTHVGLSATTEPSYPSWRPKHALQAIFLSKHFALTAQYQSKGALFSDHIPLMAEVEFDPE